MNAVNRRLDWVREPKDKRDHTLRMMFKKPLVRELPEVVDLRTYCSEVEDQGELGSCTAQTLAGALEFLARKNDKILVHKSRLFAYYNGRKMMFPPMTKRDSGCYMRTVIKGAARYGVCNEEVWPYCPNEFAKHPPLSAFADATKNQILEYAKIEGASGEEILMGVLETLARGIPVCFGFDVYPSLMTEEVARTGVVPVPDLQKEQMQGGHAVLIVGYDLKTDKLLVRNSWGANWGINGYFWLPMWFVRSGHADDFWAIEAQEYDDVAFGWFSGMRGWLSMYKPSVVAISLVLCMLMSGCIMAKNKVTRVDGSIWETKVISFWRDVTLPSATVKDGTNTVVDIKGWKSSNKSNTTVLLKLLTIAEKYVE